MVSYGVIKKSIDTALNSINQHYGVYYDGNFERHYGLTYTKTTTPYFLSGDKNHPNGLEIDNIPIEILQESKISYERDTEVINGKVCLKGTWALGFKVEKNHGGMDQITYRLFKLERKTGQDGKKESVYRFVSQAEMLEGWSMGYASQVVTSRGVQNTIVPQAMMILDGRKLEGRITFASHPKMLMDRNRNSITGELDFDWTTDKSLWQRNDGALDLIGITTHDFGTQYNLIYSHYDLTNNYLRHGVEYEKSKGWKAKYYNPEKSSFIPPEYIRKDDLSKSQLSQINDIKSICWYFSQAGIRQDVSPWGSSLAMLDERLSIIMSGVSDILSYLGASESDIKILNHPSPGKSYSKKQLLHVVHKLVKDFVLPVDPGTWNYLDVNIHLAQSLMDGFAFETDPVSNELVSKSLYSKKEAKLGGIIERDVLPLLLGSSEASMMLIWRMIYFSKRGSQIIAIPTSYHSNMLAIIANENFVKPISTSLKAGETYKTRQDVVAESYDAFRDKDSLLAAIFSLFRLGYVSDYVLGSGEVKRFFISNAESRNYIDNLIKNGEKFRLPPDQSYIHYGEIANKWVKCYGMDYIFAEKEESNNIVTATNHLIAVFKEILNDKYSHKIIKQNIDAGSLVITNKKSITENEVKGLSQLYSKYALSYLAKVLLNEPSGGRAGEGRLLTLLGQLWAELAGGKPSSSQFPLVSGNVRNTFWTSDMGKLFLDKNLFDSLGDPLLFAILFQYTYNNLVVHRIDVNIDRKFESEECRILNRLLKENEWRYDHISKKIGSVLKKYFDKHSDHNEISIKFFMNTYLGFQKYSSIGDANSGLDSDVKKLFSFKDQVKGKEVIKYGHSLKISRNDASNPVKLEAFIKSTVFYMALTGSYAFISGFSKFDGAEGKDVLLSAISPEGELMEEHQLLSLATSRKILPAKFSTLGVLGNEICNKLRPNWHKDEQGNPVYDPSYGLFPSGFSVPLYLLIEEFAKRGGYDLVTYHELIEMFFDLFSLEGKELYELRRF